MHFALANPCENTICKTLRKVYLLNAPPRRTLLQKHRNTLTLLFQEHKIVCNLPDLSCYHIQVLLFQVTLQAIMKWQNISITDPVVSECFLHFLDFGKGQTEEDIIGHRKKFDRQQADCPALAFENKPASLSILQQICNSTGWSVKVTWQLVFQASIQFFVVLDGELTLQLSI